MKIMLFTDASKPSWSRVLTQECMTTMKGKETKSLLPITNVSGTFVGSQKNLTTLIKKAYAVYMGLRNIHTTYMMKT